MFYPLPDLIVCPACKGELTLVCPTEMPRTTTMRMPAPKRVGLPGAAVGPTPPARAETDLGRLLEPLASPAAEPGRERELSVVEGVLVCGRYERWYPIRDTLPALLPDYVRDWDEDREWLAGRQPVFAAAGLDAVWQARMARCQAAGQPAPDPGGPLQKV
jgi:uncharacterized protein YbaR (Trm112 family)